MMLQLYIVLLRIAFVQASESRIGVSGSGYDDDDTSSYGGILETGSDKNEERTGKGPHNEPGIKFDEVETKRIRDMKTAAGIGALTGTFAVAVFVVFLMYKTKPNFDPEDEEGSSLLRKENLRYISFSEKEKGNFQVKDWLTVSV